MTVFRTTQPVSDDVRHVQVEAAKVLLNSTPERPNDESWDIDEEPDEEDD